VSEEIQTQIDLLATASTSIRERQFISTGARNKQVSMRLLIVTHYYPEHRGGIEIVAGELARRLAASGIDIRWAASATATTADAVPGIRRVPMSAWNVAEDRLGFPYPLWSLSSLQQLRSLVDWSDVVHLHDSLYLGNFLACRMARQAGKPVVVTQHIGEVPYKSPLLRGMLHVANRTVARRVLGAADRCVFISPRVRDFFQQFVRFREPPQYVPNGVDTDRFRPIAEGERLKAREQLGWPCDRLVCFFAGRFVEKKGLPTLRSTAMQLPECHFAFAGWGPLDPAAWGLPNVRSHGSLGAEELAMCYRAADLLVLPSVGEGFPLVVQEAAACGTPALISTETATGHDAINAFTYVCDPDAASVVAKLQTIIAHRADLAERREKAAEFARRHWNWDVVAKEYRMIFERLIAR